MGRKKKFDKKSSITFKLVHRSQRDPLVADERAPQHVFVPIGVKHVSSDTNSDIEKRREEQRKYGIYFDDEYNYLQHLRDVNQLSEWQPIDHNIDNVEDKNNKNGSQKSSIKLQFPSSLFPSNVEEKEGLLSKGVLPVGPQPDWDPEVVAAMDEDFDFEDPNNQIDDDFVIQAEEKGSDCQDIEDDDQWEDMTDSEDEESDEENVSTVCGDDRSLDERQLFSDEETKSHFTNYSLSSSVIRRNKNLTILDQRFETLFENEYANECDIGALDLDDIEGSIDPNNSELMATLVQEYEDSKNYKEVYENVGSKSFFNNYNKDYKVSEDLTQIEINENIRKGDKDRFDCESIISTYSTLYNHPKIIRESNRFPQRVQINERTGLPIGFLERPGLTAKKLAKLDAINNVNNEISNKGSKSVRSSASRLSVLSVRSKNESSEERKLRKSALKEYRRERRTEKKLNKAAFKSENIRLNKEMINLQNNLTAVKLS